MPARRLLVKGKVQGVFYRASAKSFAETIDVTGWIRNTADGDVEALVEGTQHDIDLFIEWCWEGPADAEVTVVEVQPAEEESFSSFTIRRD